MIKTKRTALLQALQKIGPIGRQDSCNKCNQQDSTLTSFKTHKEVVHEDVKYLGDQCDYQFKDKNRMGIHRESFHEGVRYSCKQCD